MITLVPMTAADFLKYRDALAAAYAQDQVESGAWNAATALQQAQDSLRTLLPEGIATPNHSLYLIHAEAIADPVGQLWISIEDGLEPSAFILDIEIYAPNQRRGYAQQTLQALEAHVKPLGIDKIGLHVHAHNHGAKALYEKMGFAVTGHAMLKRLDSDE